MINLTILKKVYPKVIRKELAVYDRNNETAKWLNLHSKVGYKIVYIGKHKDDRWFDVILQREGDVIYSKKHLALAKKEIDKLECCPECEHPFSDEHNNRKCYVRSIMKRAIVLQESEEIKVGMDIMLNDKEESNETEKVDIS